MKLRGCVRFRRRVHESRDGAGPGAELEEHLAGCSACRDLVRELEDLDGALRMLEASPPSELAGRLVASWPEQPAGRRRRWDPVAWAALIAGAVVLSAMTELVPLPEVSVPELPRLAVPAPDIRTPPALAEALRPVVQMLARAAQSVFDLEAEVPVPVAPRADAESLVTLLIFTAGGLLVPGPIRSALQKPGRRFP